MKPVTTTRVPAQLDKLVELFGADNELGEVTVYDGSPMHAPDEPDVIVIAPSTPDQPGVEVDFIEQPGLGKTYVEQAQIIVVVSSWRGDEDMKARRDRVQQIVGRIQQLLAEHQVIGGVWDAVGIGTAGEWYLVPSGTGATAAFGFAIVARSVI